MGDVALALEDAGALHLDLFGSEAFEQTAALAEEHRDDMELELVEDAGGECELRDCRAMDQYVAVARRQSRWVWFPPGTRRPVRHGQLPA